jgi:type I restriction enzyme S subunit
VTDVVSGKVDVREAAAKLPDLSTEPELLDEIDDLPQDEESAEMGELEADDAA